MGKKHRREVAGERATAAIHEGDLTWDMFVRIREELEATTFLPVTNAHVLRLCITRLHDDIFRAADLFDEEEANG